MSDDFVKSVNNLFPQLVKKHDLDYGALWSLATYCGLKHIPARIIGEWQHGLIIKEWNLHPEAIIGSNGLSRNRKYKRFFVSRQDQIDYLNTQGYSDVRAIGLPIIYAKAPQVERMPKSLLIMPIHGLDDTTESWDEETYAKYIDSISHDFDFVLCCLHISDFKKGYWKETFEKRGINIVVGGNDADSNSLNRLAYIFSKFEYVTSNGFGSHIAYASLFGAKPSISGPEPKFKREDFKDNVFYKNCPELLDVLEKWELEKTLQTNYPFLYVSPNESTDQKKWAAFELGIQFKKTPAEIKLLIGWDKYTLIKNKIKTPIAKLYVDFKRRVGIQ